MEQERIPFDIKHRPEIEAGKYLVVTREGNSVRIVCWEAKLGNPLVCLVTDDDGREDLWLYPISGRYDGKAIIGSADLFLVPNPDYRGSTVEPSEAAVWAAVGAFKPDVWLSGDGSKYRLKITAYHISKLCERCFMGEGPTIYAAAVEVYKQLMAEDKGVYKQLMAEE